MLHTLGAYVVGVTIIWAVILFAAQRWGRGAYFPALILVCAGFFIGMLAMFVAVHVYPS